MFKLPEISNSNNGYQSNRYYHQKENTNMHTNNPIIHSYNNTMNTQPLNHHHPPNVTQPPINNQQSTQTLEEINVKNIYTLPQGSHIQYEYYSETPGTPVTSKKGYIVSVEHIKTDGNYLITLKNSPGYGHIWRIKSDKIHKLYLVKENGSHSQTPLNHHQPPNVTTPLNHQTPITNNHVPSTTQYNTGLYQSGINSTNPLIRYGTSELFGDNKALEKKIEQLEANLTYAQNDITALKKSIMLLEENITLLARNIK